MTTFKLRKVKTNQSYHADDCGISYNLNPIYQDSDDTYTETELVWVKDFKVPTGYTVKKHASLSNTDDQFVLELLDTKDELMADEPVPIIDIKGRPAISTWSGGLLFLQESK